MLLLCCTIFHSFLFQQYLFMVVSRVFSFFFFLSSLLCTKLSLLPLVWSVCCFGSASGAINAPTGTNRRVPVPVESFMFRLTSILGLLSCEFFVQCFVACADWIMLNAHRVERVLDGAEEFCATVAPLSGCLGDHQTRAGYKSVWLVCGSRRHYGCTLRYHVRLEHDLLELEPCSSERFCFSVKKSTSGVNRYTAVVFCFSAAYHPWLNARI